MELAESLLFDTPAGYKCRYENLVCVDHSGGLIWTAQLPNDTLPDCFASARMDGPLILGPFNSEVQRGEFWR